MKNKIVIMSAIVLFFVIKTVIANESSGYLKDIYVSKEGQVLFRLSNPVNQRPKCANNSDWDYKLDLNKAHSGALFDMLSLAQTTSNPIRVGYGAEPACGKGFPAVIIHYVLFADLYKPSHAGKGNYSTH